MNFQHLFVSYLCHVLLSTFGTLIKRNTHFRKNTSMAFSLKCEYPYIVAYVNTGNYPRGSHISSGFQALRYSRNCTTALQSLSYILITFPHVFPVYKYCLEELLLYAVHV